MIRAILSSSVFPPSARAAADRLSASPIPSLEMAKLFILLLSRDAVLTTNGGGKAFLPYSVVSKYGLYPQFRLDLHPTIEENSEAAYVTISGITVVKDK